MLQKIKEIFQFFFFGLVLDGCDFFFYDYSGLCQVEWFGFLLVVMYYLMVIVIMYVKELQYIDVIRYQVVQQQWYVVYLGNLVYIIVVFIDWVYG